MKDRFSKMEFNELRKEVHRLTFPIHSGNGIPIPYFYSEKTLRQILRFLYANLKEDYIDKIKILEALAK